VIKDPKRSKLYQYWEVFWFFVIIVQFVLVPYTLSNSITEVLVETIRVEITIDFLWLLHMFMCFTTAFYRENELIKDVNEIALRYVKKNFLIDVISTLPTLFTWYWFPNLYLVKLIRFYYLFSCT
jgi:hypothetical protein